MLALPPIDVYSYLCGPMMAKSTRNNTGNDLQVQVKEEEHFFLAIQIQN